MIICVCHRVSDRDIARVAREGCTSFEELQAELGVATCCGKCHDCALAVFQQHANSALSDGGAGPARDALVHARPEQRLVPPHRDATSTATA